MFATDRWEAYDHACGAASRVCWAGYPLSNGRRSRTGSVKGAWPCEPRSGRLDASFALASRRLGPVLPTTCAAGCA